MKRDKEDGWYAKFKYVSQFECCKSREKLIVHIQK